MDTYSDTEMDTVLENENEDAYEIARQLFCTTHTRSAPSKSNTRTSAMTEIGRPGTHLTAPEYERPIEVQLMDGTSVLYGLNPHAVPNEKDRGKLEMRRDQALAAMADMNVPMDENLFDITSANTDPVIERYAKAGHLPTSKLESCAMLPLNMRANIEKWFKVHPEMHTMVLVFDIPHYVSWGKAPTQGSRGSSKAKLSREYAEYIQNTQGVTLEAYFGEAYYDKGNTQISQHDKRELVKQLEAEMDALDPENAPIEQLVSLNDRIDKVKRRPVLDSMLENDKPIPGPFHVLYGDKKGRGAVIRYIMRSLAFDQKYCVRLDPGKRVLIMGHCLLPEDVDQGNSESTKEDYLKTLVELQSSPLLLFNPMDSSEFLRGFFSYDPTLRNLPSDSLVEGIRRDQNLIPYPNSRNLVYAIAPTLSNTIGEADQSVMYFIRALYEEPFGARCFEIASTDSDLVLFTAPVFIANIFVRTQRVVPFIYNNATAPGFSTKIFALHRWVQDIREYLMENIPYFRDRQERAFELQQARELQSLRATFAVQRLDPQQAEKSDAMWEVADTRGDEAMSSKGEDRRSEGDVDIAAHFVALVILAGTDFNRGYYYVGFKAFLKAATDFSSEIFPLVKYNKKTECYNYVPERVLNCIKYAYVSSRGSSMPEKVAKKRVEAAAKRTFPEIAKLVAKGYTINHEESFARAMAGMTDVNEVSHEDHVEFKNNLGRCVPNNTELLSSMLAANYYLAIVSQAGNSVIYYPDERVCGYAPTRPWETISKHNIRFSYDLPEVHVY